MNRSLLTLLRCSVAALGLLGKVDPVAAEEPASGDARPTEAVAPALVPESAASIPPRVETPALRWREDWPRFHPAEYAATSALMLGMLGFIVTGAEHETNWNRTNGFDEAIRDAVRGGSATLRERSQVVSDTFYYVGLGYPIVEATLGAWAIRGSRDVAGQMLLIDLEAMATTGFLSFLSNAVIARERPYVRTCRDGSASAFPSCANGGQTESFFSGHTGMAFTTAALSCSHQAHLGLYGRAGGFLSCVAALGGATTTGVFRLIADKHYVTDVLTGAAIGLASGIVFPALHYGLGTSTLRPIVGLRALPIPLVAPGAVGLSVAGLF